jgi:predicted nucleotidyltransferase
MDIRSVLRLLKNMDEQGVDYVLVGAAALSILGIVRATEDVDLFVDPAPENVERLRTALRATWNDPSIEDIRTEDLAGDYPVIRYGPPGEAFTVDILSRLGEAFRFPDLQWETKDIEGIPVRVATPATLYRMKSTTVRLQDRADAAQLKERFGVGDDDAG